MTLTLPALVDCPLSRMVQRTPTDYWNDSCAEDDLAYAIERGAVGATSNPTIVVEVMQKEKSHWTGRVRSIAAEQPDWTELELAWTIVEGGRPRRGAPPSRLRAGVRARRPTLDPDQSVALPRCQPDARPGRPLRHART